MKKAQLLDPASAPAGESPVEVELVQLWDPDGPADAGTSHALELTED